MKGETLKWVVDHGGNRGHVIRDSRGDGSGCVAEEQNDLQEGFFYSRQGTFLIARAWRSRGEGAEHVQRSRGSDALGSALEEGVGPREGVVRRGWKRGNQ